MTNKSWKTIQKNVIYQNRFGYTLRDDDVITPAGKPGKYMVLESPGYVVMVALTSNKEVILTRQYRYPVEQDFLELPAGTLNKDEDPLLAAQRELLEETGATGKSWVKLSEYWVGNGAMKIKGHVFLCTETEFNNDTDQESTEKITHELIDFNKVYEMVVSNEIQEERTIIAILLAKDYLNKNIGVSI